MKIQKKHTILILLAVAITIADFIFLRESTSFYFLIAISLVIAGLPFIINLMSRQKIQKEKEDKFLEFSRDLVENVKSGTPISKSILNLRNRDYKSLTPHVRKLANQLTLGITLTKALQTFAKDTKSVVITRAVILISEAERAGGKIETVLESVAKSVNQIEILKKERKASISNLVTQGYLIFGVFIIIMLILEFKILPLVSDLTYSEGLNVDVKSLDPDEFSMPLFIMLIIQSLFAGLVIGKISEGTIMAGIKHSFILLTTTLIITTGARAIFGG